ncbi:unnamed protein product [Rotaria sp. Silwood2]|nr:unnamed protein product [Rotaria sp. Silwood2]
MFSPYVFNSQQSKNSNLYYILSFSYETATLTLNQELTNKQLINEVHSITDNIERKKFHPIDDDDLQFQPTSMSLSTSLITKSPPLPSPITLVKQSIIRQSSIPIQSMMITQIHSILDNIDSVLDKIEIQANSVIRRPAFNENY